MTVTLKAPKGKPKTFVVSQRARKTVEDFLNSVCEEKTIPAIEVLPVLVDSVLRPSVMLRGSRKKNEMTQKDLAKKLGILQHHLSEMEHGKRPIGKQMAKKMADVFDADYRLFI
ncbi:MAG: helix-turn-helix transcriptional regulator [Alphaproteobacteria bacterium]|nr:helix-turn-helix transcriptional regulator [Alphaproteobacteria bacterium]